MLAKCVLRILEFNNIGTSVSEEKKKKLNLSYAHVIHTTAKQVISCCGKNKNICEMSKNEKCTSKACKTITFHYVKYANFWDTVAPSSHREPIFLTYKAVASGSSLCSTAWNAKGTCNAHL